MRSLRFVPALGATVFAAMLIVAGAGARSDRGPEPNGTPTITGVAQEDQVLTGHNGSWFCDPFPCTYAFQWQRSSAGDFVDIAGAANQNYTVSFNDVGQTLRVAVTATNWDCNMTGTECRWSSATNWSSATGAVAPDPFAAPSAVSPPSVTGTMREGLTASASPGTWRGNPVSYAYRWQRCSSAGASCADIAGAATSSYDLTSDDVGSTLRVVVTATNGFGSRKATSAASAVVASAPKVKPEAPSLVALPTIVGDPVPGSTMSVLPGTWSGTPTLAFTYQWQRCDALGAVCDAITGATTGTYVVSTDDTRKTLRVDVTATNSAGSASGRSDPSALVGPAGLVLLDNGDYSIPSSSVAAPERLVVDQVLVSPSILRSRRAFVVAVHVDDTRAYVVRDARVSISGATAGLVSAPAADVTGDDGWVSFQLRPTKQLRFGPGRSLTLVVRATTRNGGWSAAVARTRSVKLPLGRAR